MVVVIALHHDNMLFRGPFWDVVLDARGSGLSRRSRADAGFCSLCSGVSYSRTDSHAHPCLQGEHVLRGEDGRVQSLSTAGVSVYRKCIYKATQVDASFSKPR